MAGIFGDDDEVYDYQDGKDNDVDNDIVLYDKGIKGFDDFVSGICVFVIV